MKIDNGKRKIMGIINNNLDLPLPLYYFYLTHDFQKLNIKYNIEIIFIV